LCLAIDEGVCVVGDGDLLAQAITNLIENATRHTPAGSRITLRLLRTGRAEVGATAGALVIVEDNGPGVPEDQRERVLQRFVRLDASRSTPGSGLGLALVAAMHPGLNILVLDCDVHGGDGTAVFTKSLPNLFNFSICGSTMGAFEGPRSIVRKVPPSDESQAWLYLNEAVDLISERRPQLVIYQAGMDPHRNDPLSRSKMSGEFLAKRDEFAMETLLSLTTPFFFVLAGGYQDTMEEKLLPLHVRTFGIAANLIAVAPTHHHPRRNR
jgi:hypothetical protein